MALTLERLEEIVQEEGLKYMKGPKGNDLVLIMQGKFDKHMVALILEEDGEFLQFRTIHYLTCKKSHPHFQDVMIMLMGINYIRKMVKIGVDIRDGEVVAYIDYPIEDGDLTTRQFSRLCSAYFVTIDTVLYRAKKIMDGQKDPGDPKLSDLLGGDDLSEILSRMGETDRDGDDSDDADDDDDGELLSGIDDEDFRSFLKRLRDKKKAADEEPSF